MNFLKNLGLLVAIPLLIALLIALVVLFPLATIWALNTLFALAIPYGFYQWLAVLILNVTVLGSVKGD